jgi:cytoskeletal protein RodZ
MNGLRHIPAGLSSLWREVRYGLLPWLVFASLIGAVVAIWHYAFVPTEIRSQQNTAPSEAVGTQDKPSSSMPWATRDSETNQIQSTP